MLIRVAGTARRRPMAEERVAARRPEAKEGVLRRPHGSPVGAFGVDGRGVGAGRHAAANAYTPAGRRSSSTGRSESATAAPLDQRAADRRRDNALQRAERPGVSAKFLVVEARIRHGDRPPTWPR